MQQPSTGRSEKLSSFLRGVLAGKRTIASPHDARLFLEAVTAHPSHASPAACLETIVASKHGAGVKAVQASVRANFALAFVTTHTLPFIGMLLSAAPELQNIASGQFLRQLVLCIVQPPALWQCLVKLFCDGSLREEDDNDNDNDGNLLAFAWLVNESLLLSDVDILDDVKAIVDNGQLLKSKSHDVRSIAYKIDKEYKLRSDTSASASSLVSAFTPGGRHDNDAADFRTIQTYPTNDELMSKAQPFYRRADEIFQNTDLDAAQRAAMHIDNQFRLLREDMLAEIRNDLQALDSKNKTSQFGGGGGGQKPRRATVLCGLTPVGLQLGDEKRGRESSLAVACRDGLAELRKHQTKAARRKFLDMHRNYLKHQSIGVFVHGSKDEIAAFAFVDRDVDLLSQGDVGGDAGDISRAGDPIVCLRFPDSRALGKVLLLLRQTAINGGEKQDVRGQSNQNRAQNSAPTAQKQTDVRFMVVGSAVFSYEPVLNQLKDIRQLPLEQSLVCPADEDASFQPVAALQSLAAQLRAKSESAAGLRLGGFPMEPSQTESLINGLTRPLAVIQGPPGTGKSFIGAQIAKCIQQHSSLKILVISYTNHALDQFLEDLRKAGIAQKDMVRLGSKSTTNTDAMLLSKQNNHLKLTPAMSVRMTDLKHEQAKLRQEVQEAFAAYQASLRYTFRDIMEHLEFEEEGQVFYNAFIVPEVEESSGGGGGGGGGGGRGKKGKDKGKSKDWSEVGRKGKKVEADYLFTSWVQGRGPGHFQAKVSAECRPVWQMDLEQRRARLAAWTSQLAQRTVDRVETLVSKSDDAQQQLDDIFSQGKKDTLQAKRIVACTTTAAAMYHKMIRASQPDVVLVEEAGEILESHVLTALASPSVKQLVLIGDHKQLRPRYNNYALTVEKGDGYNFNMSLFERLIVQGCPYTTLRRQHRMHRDLAVFPRALTYPDLLDGTGTAERDPIRGLRDRMVFVHHEQEETQLEGAADALDPEAKTSKSNLYEAEMCLRLVRYLAQQGYGTDHMVVLTPYVGQLRLLMDLMARDGGDPILNDLDTALLVQAGLMNGAEAQVGRAQLRISTIDNYQGEESDIVIGSLTRSNARGDIGFMAAPERLNVLVTRARNGLVLVGNMHTFMNSYTAKGRATWTPYFELLKKHGHLYDGIPIACERHRDDTASHLVLKQPADFDLHCPDGGCAEPCGAVISCGLHTCPRRCHRIDNHSQVPCTEHVTVTCDRGHRRQARCTKQTNGIGGSGGGGTKNACRDCAQEDKDRERQVRRNLQLEEDRLARQAAYAQSLQTIQDEIAHQKRIAKYHAEEAAQKQDLEQKKQDLRTAREAASRLEQKKAAAEKQSVDKKKKKTSHMSNGSKPKIDGLPDSAQEEWEFAKQSEGAESEALDKLMEMTGLEEVKQVFLDIKSTVDTAIRQGVLEDKQQRFGCSLLGNPGTGKTTVARLYAQFLVSMGVIPGSRFEETTGAKLAQGGVSGCQTMVDDVLNAGGGVVFIDEAYQMTSGNSAGGGAVLDYLLPEVENLTGKIVFVLAGYDKQMESFFAHNPGLPSRFPLSMRFADYSDVELLHILRSTIEKKYSGAMKCEGEGEGDDDDGGLYCRIVARRIGRGRGRAGFGNARTVQNVLATIVRRQAVRLKRERRAAGTKPDDFLFTKEDLIGPEPAEALSRSAGWKKLSKLIGVASVKQAVHALVDSVQQNYQRELAEEAPIQYSLNKVFLGNPGTGKTTVAKLYGEILGDLGLLSNGEVVVRNPSDFVGSVLGESEKLTKGILAASMGKVLVIDEAYGLYDGSNGNMYKTAVIDAIVSEVQGVPGDDRCVLLLGYKDQLEAMFQNVNPGLARRFPIASGFTFADFADDELAQILDLKLRQQSYEATGQAKRVVLEMLNRARNRPNFGNAGEIDILLDAAKARQQTRRAEKKLTEKKMAANTLEARDFDEDFDRAEGHRETNIRQLFEGTVGAEDVVAQLEGYQETVRTMRALDMDAQDVKDAVPFNFVFRGPPGTGKTTTARKMGKVFYDMGFLATAEVVECSASDLVGQYVGHTGPKVVQQLDKALGHVLFIDEAYRLSRGDGHSAFGQEAVDELVDCVTKERYHKKLVIILAGYEADINQLLAANAGLTSRFSESVSFKSLEPAHCVLLLHKTLAAQKSSLAKRKVALDLAVLEQPEAAFLAAVTDLFAQLTKQASWANSRDVLTLGKAMFSETMKNKNELAAKKLVLSEATVLAGLRNLFAERHNRETNRPMNVRMAQPPMPMPMPTSGPNIATGTAARSETRAASPEPAEDDEGEEDEQKDCKSPKPKNPHDSLRDAGVSDAVWEQLQKDRQAEEERQQEYQALLKARDAARDASDAAYDDLVRRVIEEERRRREEEAVRAKLKTMGVCPANFAWIKQDTGYRCAGGSHYMSAEQLE